jgi:hypothetical protein
MRIKFSVHTACRIASITDKDAMILPHDANPRRMEFSERTCGGPNPMRFDRAESRRAPAMGFSKQQ